MILLKSTIKDCKSCNINLYSATKKTIKDISFITCYYSVQLNDTTVTTEKKSVFEGKIQEDIVNHFYGY